MRVTAIIQARMDSTRLPGKILMEVMSRPLLSYQIERLSFSKYIEKIIIATTVNKTDDPIVLLARKEKVNLFRGAENDVLDRYYQAAKLHRARHIMRLTADCPLLQPGICDLLAAKYSEAKADYAYTGQSFAEGLDCEVVSFKALSQAWREAKHNSDREHVTLYIRNHPEKFRILTVENETDDSRYRITVDEEEDFLVVKAILENLYKENKEHFTFTEIKSFLDTHPDVYNMNAHIMRNQGLLISLQKDKRI